MSNQFICYECGSQVYWLAPDSRCGNCTRFTSEEVVGLVSVDEDEE